VTPGVRVRDGVERVLPAFVWHGAQGELLECVRRIGVYPSVVAKRGVVGVAALRPARGMVLGQTRSTRVSGRLALWPACQ